MFIHVLAYVRISFLFRLDNIYCMYVSDFTNPLMNTGMNNEHFLAIVNKGGINMCVQIPLCDPAFIYFGSMSGVKLPDHMQ